MLLVGLTGGIASGKSVIGSALRDAGARVCAGPIRTPTA